MNAASFARNAPHIRTRTPAPEPVPQPGPVKRLWRLFWQLRAERLERAARRCRERGRR